MSAVLSAVLTSISLSVFLFVLFKVFRDDSETSNDVYNVKKSLKNVISQFFLQMFVLSIVLNFTTTITMLSELGTMPLLTAWFFDILEIVNILLQVYFWFMLLYLIACAFFEIYYLVNDLKKGVKTIKWL